MALGDYSSWDFLRFGWGLEPLPSGHGTLFDSRRRIPSLLSQSIVKVVYGSRISFGDLLSEERGRTQKDADEHRPGRINGAGRLLSGVAFFFRVGPCYSVASLEKAMVSFAY
jgi:hypothetical protein